MAEIYGVCKFCGQSKFFKEELPEEELNEKATIQCNCKEGIHYRAEQEDKKRTKQMIEDAKSISFELLGNDYPNIQELVDDLVPKMIENTIDKISIAFEKIKVGIKYANDSIAITRTDTNKQSDKAVK